MAMSEEATKIAKMTVKEAAQDMTIEDATDGTNIVV